MKVYMEDTAFYDKSVKMKHSPGYIVAMFCFRMSTRFRKLGRSLLKKSEESYLNGGMTPHYRRGL